jgi:hypothetical protein
MVSAPVKRFRRARVIGQGGNCRADGTYAVLVAHKTTR